MASNNNSLARKDFSVGTTKKKECKTFEPQTWRKNVCRNCYRVQSDHPEPFTDPPPSQETTSSGSGSSASVNPASKAESPNASRRHSGATEKSKTSSPRESKKLSSTSSRSAASRQSPKRSNTVGVPSVSRSSSRISSTDPKYVEELENDFFDLEDKYAALGREKDELELEIEEKSKCVQEIQEQVNEYKTKVVLLEKKISHLEDEIRGYRERLKLPESDQASSVPTSISQANEEMRQRVDEVETLCQNLMEENEMLKEEIDEMQREIEEMHDHFQEDDTDTLRELQRELEASNKNCRIFQFKLRKAERRFEQCEAERLALEEKLQRLEMQIYSEEDRNHIRLLEEELRIAKEVSVRLNNELDLVDEKRGRYELENRNLKEEIQLSEGKRIHAENEVGRLRLEIDKMRTELGLLDKGPLQVTDKNQSRPRLTPNRSLSREPSFEEQQLQRELDATKERETDVAEQLRFAEEETRKLKRRLNDVEDENDALTRKLEALVNAKSRLGSDSEIEEDESNHSRIQVQLLEQETDILRKKIVSLEKENQILLQQKGKDSSSLSVSSDSSPSNIDMDQLRREFTHVKAKLGETTAENERLERDNQRLASLATMPPSKGSLPSRLVPTVSVDPPEERNDSYLRSENQELRAQLREFDRQLREAVGNVSKKCNASESRERDLFEKYNDSLDLVKEKEQQIGRLKKRLTDSQEELANIRKEALKKKDEEIKESTPDSKRKKERHQATRDNLLEQLNSIEKEHENSLSRVELLQKREIDLTARLKELEESSSTAQEEFESREKELLSVISSVEIKNSLLDGLLKLVQGRADQVQEELDKLHEVNVSPTKRNSSTLSDDVFEATKENENKDEAIAESSEKMKSRIRSLERLLSEERQRNLLAQKRSELSSSKDLPRRQSSVEVSNQLTEALKNEIEEKDEIISEKERLIADLKTRIEQQRKINDAMRALVDKDETDENDRKKMCDAHKLELSSYVKEVDSLRGEVQTLTNRFNEANKAKDKLYKDNMNLLQELKIREESVFEQDDEINKKNNEIRNLTRQLENDQSVITQLKTDLRKLDDNKTKIMEYESKVTSMNKEIDQLNMELTDIRSKLNDREIDLTQSEEKAKLLGDAVRNRDERIREKDELIQHINQRLQNREAEMNDLDRLLSQTTEKLGAAEIEIKELNLKQGEQEREIKSLLTKFEEVKTTSDAQASEMDKVNRQMEDLVREHKNCRTKHEALEAENAKLRERLQSKKTSSSENAEATATAISAANAATERVRKELQTLKTEYEQREKGWEKEKNSLEKKLQFANARSDSIEADSKSSENNSESQKQKTKLFVLNEQISKLNRLTIELKLQNESLQRDILENQRKYRMINEQYQAEREAWLSEKSLFEMKLKEHGDRKSALQAARQALSLVTAENSTLEADIRQLRLALETKISGLEKENSELKIKAGVNDEQQKMPKVLQRLNRGKTPVVMETSWEKEKTEVTVRLERTEKTLAKLRQEMFESDEKHSKEKEQILKESEETRDKLEKDMEGLRHMAARTLAIQQQLDSCHERLREMEDAQEREQRMWQQERVQLQYRLEEAKLQVDQWLNKIKEVSELLQAGNKEQDLDSTFKNMKSEMEKFLKSKERIPSSVTTRRRWNNSQEPGDTTSSITGSFTPLTAPRSQQQSSQQYLTTGISHRSSSMDWSQNALLQALDRSSSSADVSVKKISNYPDPTGGFLLRVSSRQNSSDSVASMPPTYLCTDPNVTSTSNGNANPEDYTQRSFTMPSKPFSNRSKMSPARQKFFENYESRFKSDSVQSLLSIESSNLGSSTKPPLPPSSASTKLASSSLSLREGSSSQATDDASSSGVSSTTSFKSGAKKESNKMKSFFSSQPKKSESTSKIHTVHKDKESKADQLKSFFSKLKSEKTESQSNKTSTTTSTSKEEPSPSSLKSPNEQTIPTENKEPVKKSIMKETKPLSDGRTASTDGKEKSISNLRSSNTSLASSSTPKQVKFETDKPDESSKSSTVDKVESTNIVKDKPSETQKESSVPSKNQTQTKSPGKNDSNPPPKLGLGVSISERRKLFGGPAKSSDSSTKPFWVKK